MKHVSEVFPSPHAAVLAAVALGLLVAALAGCASQNALQTLYALDSTYAAAATAEANYCKSSVADASVCGQMKDYDNRAFNALSPLTAAASQPGATVDSVALAAAESAVTQFAAYATQHQVKS